MSAMAEVARLIPDKAMSKSVRKRVRPCPACGYFLTVQHHYVPVRINGNNGFTVRLCSNCHDVVELLIKIRPWDCCKSKAKASHIWLYGKMVSSLPKETCSILHSIAMDTYSNEVEAAKTAMAAVEGSEKTTFRVTGGNYV